MRSEVKTSNTPMTDAVLDDMASLKVLCRRLEIEVAQLKAKNAMMEVEKEMLERDFAPYRLCYHGESEKE